MHRLLALAVCALSLFACQDWDRLETAELRIHINAGACEFSLDPLDTVTHVRVDVTGEGISPPIQVLSRADGFSYALSIRVPPGTARVVEARGYSGDPTSGGKVVSVGRGLVASTPLGVAGTTVTVFLRRVGAFTPPSSAASPKSCLKMREARAGHTATLLDDGRVFFAGGYSISGSPSVQTASSSTEIFDPQTNAFEFGPPISISSGGTRLPKAFHTATRLLSGQVLLWGGENYVGGSSNTVAPSAQFLLFSPGESAFGGVQSRATPQSIPRTQHSASLDANGKVLIVGGVTRSNATLQPADAVEWFDPATSEYKVVAGVSLPRVGAATARVNDGGTIAVVGGSDGTSPQTEVVFFAWDPGANSYIRQVLATAPRLASPGRVGPAVSTFRGGTELLALGGTSDVAGLAPLGSSEIVDVGGSTVSPGPSVGGTGGRADLCAVQLRDGSVLAIGGRTATSKGDASVMRIISSGQLGATSVLERPLPAPRYQHTCTLLADGTVLVAGGRNESTGTAEVAQDAWIYQPAPTDVQP